MSDFQIENGVLVKYTGNGGDVVIPEGVTSIGDWAFYECSSLTSVTIPDGVTSIEDDAFRYCENLTSVTISDSVTSIGDRAFSSCSSLSSVTIPDSVTSIGDGAFSGCDDLADDSGLVIIRNVLHHCKESMTSVTIPDGVTSIGDSAFEECRNLKNVTIPDSVTSIGNFAFRECRSLRSVTIPNGVTSIGESAFESCVKLMSVTIPDSVTSIEDFLFNECKKLNDFTCPSTFAEELQYILPKTKTPIILHIPDISGVSTKFRPGAAVGFAEDNRDCADENGKKYAKYIKANAVKLVGLAIEHPALLYLMLREKLIAAKDLEAVTNAVQESGNTELMAAMLEYGNSSVSEKDKAKAKAKKEERETNVTSFVFDAEKLEALNGKTFVVTGKLKTFVSRDELKECLTTCGAVLTETLAEGVDYLITNTPNSGTAKNKRAVELGIKRITEDEFNEMIGRRVE